MQSKPVKVAIALISSLLAIILFVLSVTTVASAFLRPEAITDTVVQMDVGFFGDDEFLAESIRETLPLTEIDGAQIDSDSINELMQRDSVREAVNNVLQTYTDALIEGNLDYYLTADDLAGILGSIETDIQSTFNITIVDEDYEIISALPEENLKLLRIGSLSEQTGVDLATPYVLLSAQVPIILIALCILAAFDILVLNRRKITGGLLFAGIPLAISGALFTGIGIILKLRPDIGSLSDVISLASGISDRALQNGIICLLIGIAMVAIAVIVKTILKKKQPAPDTENGEKKRPGIKALIWLLCTLAVNIAVLALCTVTVFKMLDSVPQLPERPYFVEIVGEVYSTSKTVLDLSATGMTDAQIEPLKHMLDLKELYLDSNRITDISPLAGMTELTVLTLENNQITDISPLAGMTKLTALSLENNQISDISALSGITGLEVLSMENNQIGDISALSGITELTALSLENNKIVDISPLSGMTKLTALSLENNQIKSISALSSMTEMQRLSLENNQIADISALASMKKLIEPTVYNNQISDISPIAHLTELTSLNLDDNRISDISPLANMTKLTSLSLNNNNVSDISPLSELVGLTVLSMNNNQISDLRPMEKLKNLTELYMDNNSISNTNPIILHTNLEILSLNDNEITMFTYFAFMTKLKSLGLANNKIYGPIAFINKLTQLEKLDVSGNKLQDITMFKLDIYDEDEGLRSLKEVDLRGNGITDWSPADHIPIVHGRP